MNNDNNNSVILFVTEEKRTVSILMSLPIVPGDYDNSITCTYTPNCRNIRGDLFEDAIHKAAFSVNDYLENKLHGAFKARLSVREIINHNGDHVDIGDESNGLCAVFTIMNTLLKDKFRVNIAATGVISNDGDIGKINRVKGIEAKMEALKECPVFNKEGKPGLIFYPKSNAPNPADNNSEKESSFTADNKDEKVSQSMLDELDDMGHEVHAVESVTEALDIIFKNDNHAIEFHRNVKVFLDNEKSIIKKHDHNFNIVLSALFILLILSGIIMYYWKQDDSNRKLVDGMLNLQADICFLKLKQGYIDNNTPYDILKKTDLIDKNGIMFNDELCMDEVKCRCFTVSYIVPASKKAESGDSTLQTGLGLPLLESAIKESIKRLQEKRLVTESSSSQNRIDIRYDSAY